METISLSDDQHTLTASLLCLLISSKKTSLLWDYRFNLNKTRVLKFRVSHTDPEQNKSSVYYLCCFCNPSMFL